MTRPFQAAWLCLLLLTVLGSIATPQAAGQQIPQSPSTPPTHPDDLFWDDQFGLSGTGFDSYDFVEALALAPNGDLYMGGLFERTVSLPQLNFNGLARWNGRHWAPVAPNFTGWVKALTFIGNDLYVGGVFEIGGAGHSIARWNGSTWTPLGSGMQLAGSDGFVHDIAVNNGVIYAAGQFDHADGRPASNIARWDGTSWRALGSGIDGPVYDLVFSGGTLYAGGEFTTAGGVPAPNIARWDGTSWRALGSGTNGPVHTMMPVSSTLYAGGEFTSVGGRAASNIARWDGTSWSALGAGLPQTVRALMGRGGLIYAGTAMADPDDSPALYTWDGTTWTIFGGSFAHWETEGGVYDLVQNAGNFYIGGGFEIQVGTDGHHGLFNVARWSGTDWQSLGNGLVGFFETDIAALGDTIYTTLEGGQGLLAWDGLRWLRISQTTTDGRRLSPRLLTSTDTQLYMAASSSGNNEPIARWTGTSWQQLGTAFYGPNALAADGNTLYVAHPGWINTVLQTALARWDGTAWSSLASAVSDTGSSNGYGLILTMTAANGSLYAAGSFTSIDSVSANNVARWDGTRWRALGNPAIGRINAIAYSGAQLYVASSETGKIAAWNGTQWTLIGTASGAAPLALDDLAILDGQLYITGYFTTVGGVAAKSIARWDGTRWSALGNGLADIYNIGLAPGWRLAVAGHNLYVSGQFTGAGSHESMGFARWNMYRAHKAYVPFATR